VHAAGRGFCALDPRFLTLRRKGLVARRGNGDIHVTEAPNPPEFTMKQTLIQRLTSLSMAAVMTLALLGSVSELFVGVEAQQASLAQHSTAAAPRA
jgi:hypothetical protein